MKKCKTCRRHKTNDAFYCHPEMGDGRLNVCKECFLTKCREYRQKNLDRIRAYDRKRYNTPEHRAKVKLDYARRMADPEKAKRVKEQSAAWREKNKLKRAVHIIVGSAIKRGILTPGPCQRCGKQYNVQAHHEDYSLPLNVTWLCTLCHGERHQEINKEKRKA